MLHRTIEPVEAGGSTVTSVTGRLLALPCWSQLADPLPDGSPDTAAQTDCGEECIAMVIYSYTDVAFSAGCVRQAMGMSPSDGRTTADSIRRTLSLLLRDVPVVGDNPRQSLSATRVQVALGRPVIALGTWESFPALHWVLCVGIKDKGLWVNDPWGGRRRHVTATEWDANYMGALVICEASVPARPYAGVS